MDLVQGKLEELIEFDEFNLITPVLTEEQKHFLNIDTISHTIRCKTVDLSYSNGGLINDMLRRFGNSNQKCRNTNVVHEGELIQMYLNLYLFEGYNSEAIDQLCPLGSTRLHLLRIKSRRDKLEPMDWLKKKKISLPQLTSDVHGWEEVCTRLDGMFERCLSVTRESSMPFIVSNMGDIFSRNILKTKHFYMLLALHSLKMASDEIDQLRRHLEDERIKLLELIKRSRKQQTL